MHLVTALLIAPLVGFAPTPARWADDERLGALVAVVSLPHVGQRRAFVETVADVALKELRGSGHTSCPLPLNGVGFYVAKGYDG